MEVRRKIVEGNIQCVCVYDMADMVASHPGRIDKPRHPPNLPPIPETHDTYIFIMTKLTTVRSPEGRRHQNNAIMGTTSATPLKQYVAGYDGFMIKIYHLYSFMV